MHQPKVDQNCIKYQITRDHGRTQEGLDPLQKFWALAAVQIFSEGVQTLLGTPLLVIVISKSSLWLLRLVRAYFHNKVEYRRFICFFNITIIDIDPRYLSLLLGVGFKIPNARKPWSNFPKSFQVYNYKSWIFHQTSF